MISQLDIYIDKQFLNPKLLVIKDGSYYNPDIEVTNAYLEILPPGFHENILLEVEPNFLEIIDSNILELTTPCKDKSLSELSDGLWTIRYSICPNDKLYVEYTFLRNVKQLIEFRKLYCELESCPSNELEEKLKKLKIIESYIKGAEYKAECGQYNQSLELYDYANTLIKGGNCDCK